MVAGLRQDAVEDGVHGGPQHRELARLGHPVPRDGAREGGYDRDDDAGYECHRHVLGLCALGRAVPPPGESEDDWQIMARLATAISARAIARELEPVKDNIYGQPVAHDYRNLEQIFTLNGQIGSSRDIAQFLIDNSKSMARMTTEELARRRIVCGDDSGSVNRLVQATITSGKKKITVSPASALTDANGQAKFTITATTKTGPAKVKFQDAGRPEVKTNVSVTVKNK